MKLILASTTAVYSAIMSVAMIHPTVTREAADCGALEVLHLNCPRPFIARVHRAQTGDGDAWAYSMANGAYCGIPNVREVKFRLQHAKKTWDFCIFFTISSKTEGSRS